jgi:hypothetical protein
MKEFTVTDTPGFNLTVKAWKCQKPSTLNAIEFTQSCKNNDGELSMASTYQFFMTNEELATLVEGLKNVI